MKCDACKGKLRIFLLHVRIMFVQFVSTNEALNWLKIFYSNLLSYHIYENLGLYGNHYKFIQVTCSDRVSQRFRPCQMAAAEVVCVKVFTSVSLIAKRKGIDKKRPLNCNADLILVCIFLRRNIKNIFTLIVTHK